jgi:isopentenyl diphosphate isomerase/L-lactate dehydrogenase-like FMN-dependent dehydrogenase
MGTDVFKALALALGADFVWIGAAGSLGALAYKGEEGCSVVLCDCWAMR